jgi:hypothetical protein
MDKIALLIGINYYNDNYTSQQLYGCINDIEKVKQILITRGFLEKNIMCMTDDKNIDRTSKLFPTKINILERLNNLLKGEVVDNFGNIIYITNNKNRFLYYSAHGSKIDINSPIKLDTQFNQMDFIIPYDFNRNNFISDIEIKNIINNNISNKFNLNMFFDSCVNQTVCNLAYGYFSTLNNKNIYPYQTTKNNVTHFKNVNIIKNNCQIFQMSSSTDKQDSIDVNNNNTSNGAYTMSFINCFNANPYKTYNWKKFLMIQRRWLKNHGYTQIPQLCSGSLININKKCINF